MIKFKRFLLKARLIFILLGLLGVMAWIILIGYLILGALSDSEMLKNTVFMNQIALFLGLSSLPGIVTTFISFVELNEKKIFTLEKKCPHCKQLIELKLTED
jgi:hypothetical protein